MVKNGSSNHLKKNLEALKNTVSRVVLLNMEDDLKYVLDCLTVLGSTPSNVFSNVAYKQQPEKQCGCATMHMFVPLPPLKVIHHYCLPVVLVQWHIHGDVIGFRVDEKPARVILVALRFIPLRYLYSYS